jgi:hypothetical protein
MVSILPVFEDEREKRNGEAEKRGREENGRRKKGGKDETRARERGTNSQTAPIAPMRIGASL